MYFTRNSWVWEDWHGKGRRRFLLRVRSYSGKQTKRVRGSFCKAVAHPVLPGKQLTGASRQGCGRRSSIAPSHEAGWKSAEAALLRPDELLVNAGGEGLAQALAGFTGLRV